MATKQKRKFSDRFLSLVGLSLGLLAAGGQGLFPTFLILWVACFAVGMGLLLFALFDEGLFGQFLPRHRKLSVVIIALITAVAFGGAWYRAQELAELPDLDLIFVDPKSVSVLVTNPTGKVVNLPKYEVVIWNLSHPERPNPLPIPTQTGDFIRPHSGWGPNQMMDLPQLKPLLADGDHVFGVAQALCPDCKRNHYYWLYMEHGKMGWYCELPAGQLVNWRKLFQEIRSIANAGDLIINTLAPEACRKPVTS